MTLVFQYGSNMSVARLNSNDRLDGDAKTIGVARTAESFELMFSVWSKTNNCAAADLVPSKIGRSVYGVVYDIPDFLLSQIQQKSSKESRWIRLKAKEITTSERQSILSKPMGQGSVLLPTL